MTKSALTHSRSKLKPEAFVKLNQVGAEVFYRDAPFLTWHNYRLLSIDGSTLVLPNHSSVKKEFGTTSFGPYANKPRSVAKISMLYDVLNFITLDAQIAGYNTSEQQLARKHFTAVKPAEDLIIFDRGYPSLRLMFELQMQGIDYCIRMREDWWLEVRAMLNSGEKDKDVSFKLPAKDHDLLATYNTSNDTIKFRLAVVELPDSSKEVLCTSVTDRQRLAYEDLASLYNFRWNIEEGYKLYKCRIQLEVFSGKTAQAVKQDFYAKVFTMTTAAVFAFPIEEKIKQEQQQSGRKHPYKVNRTNALALIKESMVKVFINKMFKPAIEAFDKIIKATVEVVRPGRKYPRNKIKKKPPSMNYKQL